MNKIQKNNGKILTIFMISLMLVGCSTNTNNTSSEKPLSDPKPDENNELIVARKMEPGNLDPHFINSNPTANYVYGKIYEGLVSRDQKGKYIPALAEKWEQIDDKTWRFDLRTGVKFHDGTVFNAEAVKTTFDRLLDEKVGSPRASVFSMVDEVEIVNDSTVQFHFKYPFAAFLSILASSEGSIISPMAIKDEKVDLATQPVGTGAFKFESLSSGKEMILTKFDEYWGLKPEISKVIYKIVPEDSTRLAMVETGEAHIADQLPVTEVKRLKDSNSVSVLEVEGYGVEFIGFNVTRNPFENVKVRQAIAYAIEKDAIIQGVYNNIGFPVASSMSSKVVGYNPNLIDYDYNINKAKQLLKEAGYENGFTTTLVTDERKERVNLAEVLQSQLKGIGINMEIEVMEYNTYIDQISNGKHEMYIGGWGNATGDADYNQSNVFHSSAIGPVGNFSFYSNPIVDDLIEKARQESDPQKRDALYAQLQEIELEEVPLIPVRTINHLAVVSSDVNGFWMNSVGFFNFNETSLK